MQFRIRSIDFTATGREIVREREVDSQSLTVGRGSENDIALSDLAIEQHHLSLTPQATGALKIEAAGSIGFMLDGQRKDEASLDSSGSGEISLGSYRLEITRNSTEKGGGTSITVRQVVENPAEAKDRLRGFGLETALPSRRVVSWVALAAILIAFLAIPIWTHINRDAVKPDIEGEGQVMMDASWRTGSLSLAHHGLEDNCEACHVKPFEAVRDETCVTCHDGIDDHSTSAKMADGRAPLSGGDEVLWQIAHAFNKPGPGACTDCHTEHEGAGKMQPTSEQFCADCHETLDARLTNTALGNAADFGEIHPEFKTLVVPERGAEEARMSLASANSDFGGLKFPHDMHLSTDNGVARMATRLDPSVSGMECSNCHEPNSDGVRFQPVNMEESCEDCHSLVYDKVGSTFRSLRHGDVEAMQADLRAADRAPRRPVSSGRRRPGMFAEGGIYYGNFSRISPAGLSRSALQPDGICGECHYPAASGGFDVLPVTQRSRYFSHGWFDHKPHEQEECTSCHAADTSSQASDLLMPGIETCRDCHLGEDAKEAEVPSSCAMCHSYHPPASVNQSPRNIALRSP